jgi:hypothetical protein
MVRLLKVGPPVVILGDHVLTRCWPGAPVVAAPGWVAALAVEAATANPSAVRADTRDNSSREGCGRGRHVGSIIVDLHSLNRSTISVA